MGPLRVPRVPILGPTRGIFSKLIGPGPLRSGGHSPTSFSTGEFLAAQRTLGSDVTCYSIKSLLKGVNIQKILCISTLFWTLFLDFGFFCQNSNKRKFYLWIWRRLEAKVPMPVKLMRLAVVCGNGLRSRSSWRDCLASSWLDRGTQPPGTSVHPKAWIDT